MVIKITKSYAIYIVLLLIFVSFSVASPRFITSSNLLTILRQVSMMGVAAIGATMVLLIGGIDLSIGAGITFFNIFCAYLMVNQGIHPVPAVLINVLVLTVIGMLQGLLITTLNIPAFIVTMAFMNVLKGAAYLICDGLPIFGFKEGFKFIGQGYISGLPVPLFFMVACFIIGAIILYKLYFGRYLYAIGGNEEAAKLSGINVKSVKIAVYALSSFFASISGLLFLSRLNTGQSSTGSGFEFDVITACILGGVSISGGRGKISGVIAGVLIMGMIDNGFILIGINEYYQWIIKGIVLLLAVGFDCLQRNRVDL